ncbi:MAG TPA: cation diffusion facilitator family transporter [Jatrophihabitantaceae bacterium]|jgi:cation diffusion facilitator family transporter|nr:cation diffusion facilitator family transporter [Jatrophihabitantaceae bacterium]
MPDAKDGGGDSTLSVVTALAANVGVGLVKLVAGLFSGSGALLSEAAHSAGDSTTELLLLVALRRSDRPADRQHPFGYGKERYFWSLLAAVAIFVSGAAFSIFEGIHTILSPAEDSGMLWVSYPALAIAFVFEGTSLRVAVRQLRAHIQRRHQTLRQYLANPIDPTVNSVTLEDSAALVGICLAALGVGLHQLTGSKVWDGLASLAIGCLLLVVAFVLARTCEALLIGKQADPRLMRAIEQRLEEQDEVVDVVDLLTMLTGTGRVLLCTRVDFVDTVSAGELERACVRVAEQLNTEFPELDEIFIQPASREDRTVRERVRGRYGHVLADE